MNMFRRRSLWMLKNGVYLWTSKCCKISTSVFPVLHSKFDKDLPNPNLPTPLSKAFKPDTDILLEQLKKSDSLERLLELMNMHLDVMNSKHIVACLDNINSYLKEDSSKGRDLLENPTFKSFSTRLMKVIRLFEPQEVITAYKTFSALEVRNNTYIMQCILKMLGAHLNNMTLGQLTFLSFLIHKQRHNPLVDGLRLAIPLVIQVQIDQQLDSDNMKEVVNCLQLCCRAALKPATIQKIVNVVMEKASLLSTDDALTVIFALLNIDTPIDGYNELLNIAFDVLSKNVEEISSTKLCTILRTCRHQRFYHVKFFYTVADYIVSRKWNLESTYIVTSNLHALGFCPQNLLDHFAEVLCQESTQYHSNNLYSPLSCIEFLTATSYHPSKVDEAARVLYTESDKLERYKTTKPHLLMKFLSCLAMLGHFPHEQLSAVLNEDNLYDIWSLYRKIGRSSEFDYHLMSLFWSLEVYDETENFIIPPSVLKKVLYSVYQKNVDQEYPLKKFIENGLGGPQFLQSGIFTENGHVIDHLVAMRCGNYPVSLQNIKSKDRKDRYVENFSFVEDIILPEDTKIIAVLVAYEKDYFRDPEILRGWIDIKVRNLEKKKYSVVVVNYTVWKNLPDREKIPYLMREIKQAVIDDCAQKSDYS